MKTPKPISDRAAREKTYSVSGFRPSTAKEPAASKVTRCCEETKEHQVTRANMKPGPDWSQHNGVSRQSLELLEEAEQPTCQAPCNIDEPVQ